ncbi:MAG: hypothetical protein Q9218_003845 [Villophora microphyllina]
MCVIERFHRIHPNGHREPRERLRHCEFGTPSTPCNATRVVNAMDELLDPTPEVPLPPRHHIVEPRAINQQRSATHNKKTKKVYDGLKLVFDFHVPFTSHNKKETKKPKKDPRHGERMERPPTPAYIAVPPHLRQPPPPINHHGPGMTPFPPPAPTPRPPALGPQVIHPGGHTTPPIIVHSLSSTNSSPSPISPIREHRRPRARSVSLTRQYEERKQAIREQEWREHAERLAIAERDRRIRAEREAERIRDERDQERRRNEDLRAREQRRLSHEMRHRIDDAKKERRRRSREERERVAAAVVARRQTALPVSALRGFPVGPVMQRRFITITTIIIITNPNVAASNNKREKTLSSEEIESSTMQLDRPSGLNQTAYSRDGPPRMGPDAAEQLVLEEE